MTIEILIGTIALLLSLFCIILIVINTMMIQEVYHGLQDRDMFPMQYNPALHPDPQNRGDKSVPLWIMQRQKDKSWKRVEMNKKEYFTYYDILPKVKHIVPTAKGSCKTQDPHKTFKKVIGE